MFLEREKRGIIALRQQQGLGGRQSILLWSSGTWGHGQWWTPGAQRDFPAQMNLWKLMQGVRRACSDPLDVFLAPSPPWTLPSPGIWGSQAQLGLQRQSSGPRGSLLRNAARCGGSKPRRGRGSSVPGQQLRAQRPAWLHQILVVGILSAAPHLLLLSFICTC